MTDAAIQSISLVVIALFSMVGTIVIAWFSYLTSLAAKDAAATTKVTQGIAQETHKLAEKTELNTNSMKDALVEATRSAALAKGKDEARTEGEAKAATLEQGRRAGMEAAVSQAVGPAATGSPPVNVGTIGPTAEQTKAAAATVDAADKTVKAAAKTVEAMKGTKP